MSHDTAGSLGAHSEDRVKLFLSACGIRNAADVFSRKINEIRNALNVTSIDRQIAVMQSLANENNANGIFICGAKVISNVYGVRWKTDFFVFHRTRFPFGLIIENKYQKVSGSTDEKLPFIVSSLKNADARTQTALFITGGGVRPMAVRWAVSQSEVINNFVCLTDDGQIDAYLRTGKIRRQRSSSGLSTTQMRTKTQSYADSGSSTGWKDMDSTGFALS